MTFIIFANTVLVSDHFLTQSNTNIITNILFEEIFTPQFYRCTDDSLFTSTVAVLLVGHVYCDGSC